MSLSISLDDLLGALFDDALFDTLLDDVLFDASSGTFTGAITGASIGAPPVCACVLWLLWSDWWKRREDKRPGAYVNSSLEDANADATLFFTTFLRPIFSAFMVRFIRVGAGNRLYLSRICVCVCVCTCVCMCVCV